jgi:xanthine dehydrogenase accessory factor
LIGSRAKVARLYDALTTEQMPAETLTRVHAPIGLDIGAVTPQEIAVSILAELIAVKHGKPQSTSMRWTPPQLSILKSQV